MQIPADIDAKARWWGLDPALIAAVDVAEGGGERLTQAVRCGVPTVRDRAHAIEITCRSCTHAMSDFIKRNMAKMGTDHLDIHDFIYYWALRWAPPDADNDPNDLNPNWPKNVIKAFNQLSLHPPHDATA